MIDEYKFIVDGPDGSYIVKVRVPDFIFVEATWNGIKFTGAERMFKYGCAEVEYTRAA